MRKFFFTYMPASLLLVFLAMILWTCGGGGGVGGGTPDMAFPADVAPDVVIPPTATIGSNPVIGTRTIIDKWVTIGDDCEIGDGVTLKKYVTAGDNFKVGNNTVINQYVSIGDDVKLGEDLVIDRYVEIGSNVTIGNGTMIGQDANIGDDVTIGEGVRMGKDVTVESNVYIGDFAVISANTTVSLVFTNEMLAGKTFQPFGDPGEVDLIQFAADGSGTEYDSFDDGQGGGYVDMSSLIWSIDVNGRLLLELPDYNTSAVVTLLAETATYLEVQVDIVNGPTETGHLTKTIPFDAATLPGTYSVSNGMTAIFNPNGTGSATDGSQTYTFNWSVDTAGVLKLSNPEIGSNTDYLLATSNPPNTLHVVGIAQGTDEIIDELFEETWTRQ